jgi:hypothetical protein
VTDEKQLPGIFTSIVPNFGDATNGPTFLTEPDKVPRDSVTEVFGIGTMDVAATTEVVEESVQDITRKWNTEKLRQIEAAAQIHLDPLVAAMKPGPDDMANPADACFNKAFQVYRVGLKHPKVEATASNILKKLLE